MKEQILKLRSEGLTYNQISEEVGCAKSTVSYYCGENQKEKSRVRLSKNRKRTEEIVRSRMDGFIRNNVFAFRRGHQRLGMKTSRLSAGYDKFYMKIMNNPVCYLTGRNIDLSKPSTFNLDHIIPVHKGGSNSLTNCGLTHKDANTAKGTLLMDDFMKLCKEVLTYNGYTVTKKDNDCVKEKM